MLFRIVFAAETVGSTGVSTLSLAQILGVSERNNRRDQITSGLMFHDGWCLQGIEGRRADLDRLMRRMSEDRRLRNIKVLIDKPIRARSFCHALALCDDPRAMLAAVHLADLAEITGYQAEQIVEMKQAA